MLEAASNPMPEISATLAVLDLRVPVRGQRVERTASTAEAYRDACVTHEPRCSRIGPSPTFAIIAAPSRSPKKINPTNSRHMTPSRFRIRSGSDAPVYNCRVSQTHDRPRARVIWINALEEEEPRRPGSPARRKRT